MKKFFTTALAVMMGLVMSLVSSAQTDEIATSTEVPTPDSAKIAAAFLSQPAEGYYGNFFFARVDSTGTEEYVSGYFEMNTAGKITGLSLVQDDNWIEIIRPGDEPLDGLPVNTRGTCRDYSLYLIGYNSNRQEVGHGNFTTKILDPSDPIVVILTPSLREQFVPYTSPNGAQPEDLVVETIDGSMIFYYDQYRQGFSLWLDPALDQELQVRNNRTGVIYWRGLASELGQEPSSQIVNIGYAGGVTKLFSSTRTWDHHEDEDLDGQVVDQTGNIVPAKVYMMNLSGYSAQFYFWDWQGGTGVMEVFAVNDQGDLSLIQADELFADMSYTIPIDPGYDQLVVVIRGEVSSFSMQASRYDNNAKG